MDILRPCIYIYIYRYNIIHAEHTTISPFSFIYSRFHDSEHYPRLPVKGRLLHHPTKEYINTLFSSSTRATHTQRANVPEMTAKTNGVIQVSCATTYHHPRYIHESRSRHATDSDKQLVQHKKNDVIVRLMTPDTRVLCRQRHIVNIFFSFFDVSSFLQVEKQHELRELRKEWREHMTPSLLAYKSTPKRQTAQNTPSNAF